MCTKTFGLILSASSSFLLIFVPMPSSSLSLESFSSVNYLNVLIKYKKFRFISSEMFIINNIGNLLKSFLSTFVMLISLVFYLEQWQVLVQMGVGL